mgnify:CR=1 FL=1
MAVSNKGYQVSSLCRIYNDTEKAVRQGLHEKERVLY